MSYGSRCRDLIRRFHIVCSEHLSSCEISPVERHEQSKSITSPGERFGPLEDCNQASTPVDLSRSHESKTTFSSITYHEEDFVLHDSSGGWVPLIESIGPRQYGPPDRFRAHRKTTRHIARYCFFFNLSHKITASHLIHQSFNSKVLWCKFNSQPCLPNNI
jgi:hypothetical protein